VISPARPASWRAPWLSATLTLVAFAIDRFRWDLALRRDAVLRGELFRLVTGHLSHFNRAHLLGDALAFAVWAACVEQRGRARLATILVVTTCGTSLLLLALCPEAREYRGLSAVDCALVTELLVAGVADRLRSGDRLGTSVFVGAGLVFLAKTVFEFRTGHAVLAPELGASVSLLPASHLFGIALGLACLAAEGPRAARRSPLSNREGAALTLGSPPRS
jgi:rhomboid family GlyGly-CTERM serine protease